MFAVQPGQSFIVVVGGAGTAGSQFEYDFGFGNTGGGGLSGVFLGADALDENGWTRALVIAGGGGGDGVTHEGTCLTASPGNHPNSGGQSTMRGGVGLDDGVNGGGGGYRGGPGGAVHETGTGGSGFPEANAPDKPASLVASLLAHAEIGDTKPPRADDPDYDGHAGETETSGHVVVHFKCDEPSIGNGP